MASEPGRPAVPGVAGYDSHAMEGFRWDSLRHPRGSLPAATYWWRRAAVGAAVLALIGLGAALGYGVLRHGGNANVAARPPSAVGRPGVSGVPGPSPAGPTRPTVSFAISPTATVRPPATTPPPVACDATVQLTLAASAVSYPAGSAPAFSATLANTGPACSVAGGLSIVVFSGTDRIWSSTDCPAVNSTGGPNVQLPARGATLASRSWQRTRSNPGCAPVNGSTQTVPGTYRATATWGPATSPEVVFHLD